MNKAITITLNETAFEIEEAAYDKLKKYLDSVDDYFYDDEAKEEILKDIENNFASKLEEKLIRRKQKIVLEKDIEDLISVIGKVEDFEKEESENSKKENKYKNNYSYKKLYRNPDDVIVAGVCSGIATYLSLDVNAVRILYVIFTIFTGFFPGLIIYVVLWAILPIAKTGSQKLEMEGEIINLKNLKEKIYQIKEDIKRATVGEYKKDHFKKKVKNFKEEIENEINKEKENYKEEIIKAKKELKEELSKTENISKIEKRENIIYFIVKIFLIIMGISFIVSAVSGLIGLAFGIIFSILNPGLMFGFININGVNSSHLQIISILGMLIALVPLIFIFVGGISLLKMRNYFKIGTSIFLLIAWIVLISFLVSFTTRIFGYSDYSNINPIKININTPNIYNNKDIDNLNLEESIYNLSNFNSLNINGPYSINIKKSDKFLVKVKASESALNNIEIKTEKNLLKIKNKNYFIKSELVFIEIEMPSINKIDINGLSKVDLKDFEENNLDLNINGASTLNIDSIIKNNLNIEANGLSYVVLNNKDNYINSVNSKISGASKLFLNNINSNNIKIDINGASLFESNGKVNNLDLKSNGASNSNLLNLESQNSKIILEAASNCKINSVNSLNAKLSGASNLSYIGDPIITKDVSDISTIDKIENLNNQIESNINTSTF